jgi:hypothetical protein
MIAQKKKAVRMEFPTRRYPPQQGQGLQIIQIFLVLGSLAGIATIGIVFGILMANANSKVSDLQADLDALKPIVTQTFCFEGCDAVFGVCQNASDCTAPEFVAGSTVSPVTCDLGFCAVQVIPPAFPVAIEFGQKLCRDALEDANEACLTAAVVPGVGTADGCMYFNGCAPTNFSLVP